MYEDVWVVVPVFNEEQTVGSTVTDLLQTFSNVVCVDDGSTDGSHQVARASGATVLRHVLNQGQGAALQTGFDFILQSTNARHVVTFDADGQHLVSDAAHMVERARTTGVDVVLASRFTGTTHEIPRLRRMILKTAVRFTRFTAKLDVTDTHNGLRVLSRRTLTRIHLELPRMAYASEFLDAIVPNDLSYIEEPVTVRYTDYSLGKGQRNSNSLNILFDLAVRKIRSVR